MILFYSIISFLGGVSIVASRMLNSKIGEKLGQLTGVFYNFIGGLIFSTFLLIIYMVTQRVSFSSFTFTGFPIYYYFGGLLGIATIFLSNIFVPKLSALYFSLFMFTGQLISSMIFDYILFSDFSFGKLLGAVLVVIGLVINLLADRDEQKVTKE